MILRRKLTKLGLVYLKDINQTKTSLKYWGYLHVMWHRITDNHVPGASVGSLSFKLTKLTKLQDGKNPDLFKGVVWLANKISRPNIIYYLFHLRLFPPWSVLAVVCISSVGSVSALTLTTPCTIYTIYTSTHLPLCFCNWPFQRRKSPAVSADCSLVTRVLMRSGDICWAAVIGSCCNQGFSEGYMNDID